MSAFDIYDAIIIGGVLFLSGGYFIWKNSSKNTQKPAIAPGLASNQKPNSSFKGKSRSLLEKLNGLGHEKMVVIFFGSQTGTAEDLAIRTQNDISSKLSIPAVVLDTDDYDMEELGEWKNLDSSKQWLVGFFMATYGEGEPTDNCADFYSWIMDGQGTVADKGDQDDDMVADQVCENINYFVFGLGNKTYEYYNAIARRLDKRLEKLGAKRIITHGEGNDDESMEEDYLQWAPTLLKEIGKHFGVSIDASSQRLPHVPVIDALFLESSDVLFRGEMTSKKPRKWSHISNGVYQEENTKAAYDAKNPYYSRIVDSRTLFVDSNDVAEFNKTDSVQIKSKKFIVQGAKVTTPRQCYHLEFDLSESGLSYKSGDHVGVWGHNDLGKVEKLANLLKIEKLDGIVSLKPNPNNPMSATTKIPFPQPTSVKDILTYYLDIVAPCKQHHFLIFAKYASDEEEKKRLFALSENREEFVALVESGQKTLSCVLEDFPSIKLPLGVVLIEILRPVTVRYYSISSSSLESPKQVSVTAVVVRYPLSQNHLRLAKKNRIVPKEGFATSCLERVHEYRVKSPQDSSSNDGRVPKLYLPIYIRASNFRLPKDPTKPVVMVGPGTGVAPFRAFFRERFLLASQGVEVGPTWLFFGSRNEKSDNLYAQEFADLLHNVKEKNLKIDLRLITAFSRDTAKKVYVQHRLQENGEQVWNLLQQGYFYICGDAKRMAADVNQTLEKIAMTQGKLDEKGAKLWIKTLRNQYRYLEDVWS